MTLHALLRGWYRRFPFVFAYILVGFLADVIEVPTRIAAYFNRQVAPHTPATYYWLDEVLLQVLMFALVVNLISSATARLRSRRILRAALIGAPLLIAAVALAVEYRSGVEYGVWITPWLRDLNFSSSMLDLLLWMLLIASQQREYKLLMLSGALGIQFTGEAIGNALRTMATPRQSRPLSFTGTILFGLADMACLFIWWRAFRQPPEDTKKAGAVHPMRGSR